MSTRRLCGFVFPKDAQAASTCSYRKTGNIAHPVGWGKFSGWKWRGGVRRLLRTWGRSRTPTYGMRDEKCGALTKPTFGVRFPLDQVVHGYAERLGDGGQRSCGAGALSRLDLREVDRVDADGGGQLALRHAAMVSVYADGVFTGQETIRDLGGKGLAPLRSGAIIKLHIAQDRLGVPVRETLILTSRDDGERRLAEVVKNDLRLVHAVLLFLISLTPRSDAQHVDAAAGLHAPDKTPTIAHPVGWGKQWVFADTRKTPPGREI